MTKKTYESPELDVMLITREEIITDSNDKDGKLPLEGEQSDDL